MARGRGSVLLVVGLIVGIVVALGLGTWQLVDKSRPAPELVANQTNARDEVLDVVTVNVEKILSYTPQTDDADVDDNATLLTGQAVDNYRDMMQSKVSIARSNGVTQTSTIRKAAVEGLSADKAQVLTFVDQATASTGNGTRTQAALAIQVNLSKVDGTWLIEAITTL
ncbi:hypothetical protein [Mycolicibacterium sp. XJ870]